MMSSEVATSFQGVGVERAGAGRVAIDFKLLYELPPGVDADAVFGLVFGAVAEALPENAAGAWRVAAEGSAVVVEAQRA